MQADPQARQRPGPLDGVLYSGCADHQACSGQYSVSAGKLDSFVDTLMQTEVISRDDQPATRLRGATGYAVHHASWARRKRKNSTPSRRRRFIMSHLEIISRRISQIFDCRK